MNRFAVLGLVLLIAGLAFAAGFLWLHYYPPAPFILAIGMPSAVPSDGSRCGPWYARTIMGQVPVRRWSCSISDPTKPMDYRVVTIDGLTRKAIFATREWQFTDSASWRHVQDSLSADFGGQGGRQTSCDLHPVQTITRVSNAWHFATHAVRLTAYSWRPPASVSQRAYWRLQLDAYPGGLPRGYCR
jgi:hypothetical protein